MLKRMSARGVIASAGIVAVLGFSAIILQHPTTSEGYSPPPGYKIGAEAPGLPAILFVGDSYALGVGNAASASSAGDPAEGFACRVANALHSICNLDGQQGTGYANPSTGTSAAGPNSAYPQRIERDVRTLQANTVIISGGRNDAQYDPALVAAAAQQSLQDLRVGYPKARLVVIAPFWSDSSPPANLLILRGRLREDARRMGAIFIDPLAEHWITDQNKAQYIARDGVHPNNAGHIYLAQRVEQDLTLRSAP